MTDQPDDTIKQRAQACAGAIVPECVALYGGHSIRPWIVEVAVPVIEDEIAQAVIDMGTQSELDGLRKAAGLVCTRFCGDEGYGDAFRLRSRPGWFHEWGPTGGQVSYMECSAAPIHDEIAKLERDRQ